MDNNNVRTQDLEFGEGSIVIEPPIPNTPTISEGGKVNDDNKRLAPSRVVTEPDAVPNSDAYTYYFSDIFTSSTDFCDTLEPLMIWSIPTLGGRTLLTQLYGYISRHYHNVNVRYTRKDDFISALAEVLDNCYWLIDKRTTLIRRLREFTPEQVQVISKMLNSYADAPNYTQPMDKVGEYVTNQTYTQQEQSIFAAYLDIINSTPTMEVQRILNESGLDALFMQVLPEKITCYGGNNL